MSDQAAIIVLFAAVIFLAGSNVLLWMCVTNHDNAVRLLTDKIMGRR